MKENSPEFVSFLGVGSNMGDAADNCRRAVGWIDGSGSVKVLRKSSLYRTEPVGMSDQAWFVNCAVETRTALEPHELLRFLNEIEDRMGRVRVQKGGPRIIDLDILFYGQAIIRDEALQVPHPELHRRRFVLEPLNEIAPYVIHPVYGISVKGLLERLSDPAVVEKIGAMP